MKILFQIIFWFVVILVVIGTIVIIRANHLQKKKDEEKLKKLQDDIEKEEVKEEEVTGVEKISTLESYDEKFYLVKEEITYDGKKLILKSKSDGKIIVIEIPSWEVYYTWPLADYHGIDSLEKLNKLWFSINFNTTRPTPWGPTAVWDIKSIKSESVISLKSIFKEALRETFEYHKEDFLKLKKESEFPDSFIDAMPNNLDFYDEWGINEVMDDIEELGIKIISEKTGAHRDDIIEFWEGEEFRIRFQSDAHDEIQAFWEQLKATEEKVTKEPSETEQEPAKSFFFPNTNKFNSSTNLNSKTNIFPPKLTLDKKYKNIKDDLKGIDIDKINWISKIKDLRKIDFDKKGLEFYFLSWYTAYGAYLQLEKSDNNTSDKIINEWDEGYLINIGEEDGFDETNEIYDTSIMGDLWLDCINEKTYIKKMKEKFLEFENENYKDDDDWDWFIAWMGMEDNFSNYNSSNTDLWMPMEELGFDFKNSKGMIKHLLKGINIIDTGYKVSWFSAKEDEGSKYVLGYSYNNGKTNFTE